MISSGETGGKKWQNYSGSFIKPKDHPLFEQIKGWYVYCNQHGTHAVFLAWHPHNSPGMWAVRPDGDNWVAISEDYPLIASA